MKNIYYMIWSDAINSFKRNHPNQVNWKLPLFIYITWMNALNLFIVFLWIKYFNVLNIPKFNINIFPGTLLDGFLTFTIEFALPFSILNYFLIFHRNRYQFIIKKYGNIKIRYAPIYSFTVAILALISAILSGILK